MKKNCQNIKSIYKADRETGLGSSSSRSSALILYKELPDGNTSTHLRW